MLNGALADLVDPFGNLLGTEGNIFRFKDRTSFIRCDGYEAREPLKHTLYPGFSCSMQGCLVVNYRSACNSLVARFILYVLSFLFDCVS